MSFGFGFGDFAAALKIANDLHRDVHLSGGAAPQEMQLLRELYLILSVTPKE
jgi:hypothetical protein